MALEAVGAIEPTSGQWLGTIGVRDVWFIVLGFLDIDNRSWGIECINSDFEVNEMKQ